MLTKGEVKALRLRAKWAWRKVSVQVVGPRTRPRLLRKQGATIGENCQIYTTFLGTEPHRVFIGDRCLIAGDVLFLTHDTGAFSTGVKTVFDTIEIGDDVFVGQRAILLPGTRIGDKAVVGAGSVVRGEVPEGMVYVGNPARPVCTTAEYCDKQVRRRLSKGLDPFAYGKQQPSEPRTAESLPAEPGAADQP